MLMHLLIQIPYELSWSSIFVLRSATHTPSHADKPASKLRKMQLILEVTVNVTVKSLITN